MLLAIRRQAVPQLADTRHRQVPERATRRERRVAADFARGLAKAELRGDRGVTGIGACPELVERGLAGLGRFAGADEIFGQRVEGPLQLCLMVFQHRIVVVHGQQRRLELALQGCDVQRRAHAPRHRGAQLCIGRAGQRLAEAVLMALHRLATKIVRTQEELGRGGRRRRYQAERCAAKRQRGTQQGHFKLPPERAFIGGF